MTRTTNSCSRLNRSALVAFAISLAWTLGGCGGGQAAKIDQATPDLGATTAEGTTTQPAQAIATTTDMYDVGGHQLYMTCAGIGPMTVVYVHGWVNDASYVPHTSAQAISDLLDDDFRVCRYDRRNVGSSESVDAVQTPKDMLQDMEGVLAGGGVEPPYILMAASFGGLVATAYLNAHPGDVAGMVLIDTMFPDELRLDRYLGATTASSTTTATTSAAPRSGSHSSLSSPRSNLTSATNRPFPSSTSPPNRNRGTRTTSSRPRTTHESLARNARTSTASPPASFGG